MQIRAGDTLHFLIREKAAEQIPEFLRRWRKAAWVVPDGTAPAEPSGLITRPWMAADGDPSDPEMVNWSPVVDVLRSVAIGTARWSAWRVEAPPSSGTGM